MLYKHSVLSLPRILCLIHHIHCKNILCLSTYFVCFPVLQAQLPHTHIRVLLLLHSFFFHFHLLPGRLFSLGIAERSGPHLHQYKDNPLSFSPALPVLFQEILFCEAYLLPRFCLYCPIRLQTHLHVYKKSVQLLRILLPLHLL